ncbi:MAG TPA: adenosylmethionine--8-amino-7-oxononanoate transaminase [Candidatus Binataceae bacterium]|nr:adenosylmethionine--8-amino-7-oxononanoate transaminase [Candidatus Binataceae bacterium]
MRNERKDALVQADHRYLWHPFTQMRAWMEQEPLIIERGEGNYLIDVDGNRYLDGVSSLWCNLHGHRKAELDRALKAQIDQIAHSTMLGMAHAPAIELGRKLIEIAPAGLTRVFYSDSGAEAVEVAARIAIQYWQLAGQSNRTRLLTLTESYHGDTVGSVSLGYSEHFHRHVRSMLYPVLKIDPPHVFRFYRGLSAEAAVDAALASAREVIAKNGNELAGLIIEPLMQGAAGMWAHPARYLGELTAMIKQAGALVICDEVATGFGRTGKMFACEHAGMRPDMLCLGKGITGGYLPLAATMTSEEIFSAFLGEPHEFRAFYYGHTYTGNPLGTAVAIANLKIFRDEAVLERIQPLIAKLKDGLAQRFGDLPHVADIRQWGMMAGVELMRDPQNRISYDVSELIGVRVAKAARKQGVAIRPLGDVIVFMPPLSINAGELDTLLDVAAESVREIANV